MCETGSAGEPSAVVAPALLVGVTFTENAA
jgi:hypothetical protein